MRGWDFPSVCLVLASVLLAAAFSFGAGSSLVEKWYGEEHDHGATAWGYIHRLNVVNTDCKKAPGGYACAVILSTGPSRFVLCKDGACEEIVPQ